MDFPLCSAEDTINILQLSLSWRWDPGIWQRLGTGGETIGKPSLITTALHKDIPRSVIRAILVSLLNFRLQFVQVQQFQC